MNPNKPNCVRGRPHIVTLILPALLPLLLFDPLANARTDATLALPGGDGGCAIDLSAFNKLGMPLVKPAVPVEAKKSAPDDSLTTPAGIDPKVFELRLWTAEGLDPVLQAGQPKYENIRVTVESEPGGDKLVMKAYLNANAAPVVLTAGASGEMTSESDGSRVLAACASLFKDILFKVRHELAQMVTVPERIEFRADFFAGPITWRKMPAAYYTPVIRPDTARKVYSEDIIRSLREGTLSTADLTKELPLPAVDDIKVVAANMGRQLLEDFIPVPNEKQPPWYAVVRYLKNGQDTYAMFVWQDPKRRRAPTQFHADLKSAYGQFDWIASGQIEVVLDSGTPQLDFHRSREIGGETDKWLDELPARQKKAFDIALISAAQPLGPFGKWLQLNTYTRLHVDGGLLLRPFDYVAGRLLPR